MALAERRRYPDRTMAESPHLHILKSAWIVAAIGMLGACASLSRTDPLVVSVAGIEPLPGEGLELRLAVRLRVQNPNDTPVDYSGAALSLEVNGRDLASGVSAETGTVPRYGETVVTIPVTAGPFNMARQILGLVTGDPAERNEVEYRVRGKLEGGLFGTRRFDQSGRFEWPAGEID
jgi:hypothetical protein